MIYFIDIFDIDLQVLVNDKTSGRIENKEWIKLKNKYDKLHKKILLSLPEDEKENFKESYNILIRMKEAEICLAYQAGLYDGIMIKNELGR